MENFIFLWSFVEVSSIVIKGARTKLFFSCVLGEEKIKRKGLERNEKSGMNLF